MPFLVFPSCLRQGGALCHCISQANSRTCGIPLSLFIYLVNFNGYFACMSVCLYTMCILDTQEGQKKVLDSQERELEIAESYHVRARN